MAAFVSNLVEQDIMLLRCSSCSMGELQVSDEALRCVRCSRRFEVVDGIAHFVESRGELSGLDYAQQDWLVRERAREKEYEQSGVLSHEWLRSLPFPTQEAASTFQYKNGALGTNFLKAIDGLKLSGKETVLDLASGTCWTSRDLADRGCTVFATDIRTIKYTGLRSAEAYFEAGSKPFHRLCWTFGPTPFHDEVFDLVVCNNAFQYVKRLDQMLTEIHRVLKPDGKLVLTWTGARAPLKSKHWGPGHSLSTYLQEARRAGFDSDDCWVPNSLFGQTGLVRTRPLSTLQKPFAVMFDAAWILLTPFHGQLLGQPMVFAAKWIGLPFNLICRKRGIGD